MFQERRTFATCVFCGSSDLSREHLFGKSFADFLNVKTNWATEHNGQIRKGSSPLTNIAPRMLCQACNSGLSQVMSQSLPALKAMATGAAFQQFEPPTRTALVHYFERLGFLLDAYTSNYELEVNTEKVQQEARDSGRLRTLPPIFSSFDRKEWIDHRRPQERIHIHIGHHPGVLGLLIPFHNTFFEIWQRRPDGSLAEVLGGKRFAIALKHLAICIELGEEFPRPRPNSFYDVRSLHGWPPPASVSYLDFYALPNARDPRVQRLIGAWSNPIRRAAAEAWMRRMNKGF